MQDFPSGLLSYLFKISYNNLSKYDEKKKCVSMYSNHYKTDLLIIFVHTYDDLEHLQ